MTAYKTILEIHEAIAALCPIDGIAVDDGEVVRIDYREKATKDQRAKADKAAKGMTLEP